MICRTCGTTIADKAIVCFRCGTPTALPPVPGRVRPAARRPQWLAIPVLFAIIGGAVWLVPKTPADSVSRWAAWACAAVLAVVTVIWLRGRPPSN